MKDAEPVYFIEADLTDNAPPDLAKWGWVAVVDPAVGGVVAYANPAFMALLKPLITAARAHAAGQEGPNRAALVAALRPFRDNDDD